MRRIAQLTALLAALAISTAAAAATVVLDAYDAAGNPISYSEFIATLEADGWRNDTTYVLADGTVATFQPLYASAGKPAFDVAGAPLGLSLAWPTAGTGYSTLFLDNAGAGFSSGTVNFTYRAALDYQAKLADALARRPAFVPTVAFSAAKQEAASLIVQATVAATESQRGALGQQALDALARAFELLLRDYGLQRARATSSDLWWGVTVDRIANHPSVVASISDLVQNDAGRGYVRIVFDEGVPATTYDAFVAAALSAGQVVVGEILDSFAFRQYTLAEWQARVAEYVDHFPAITVWEIGNEVNGEWLGPQVREKLEYAAAYVKAADPSDKTMLTFYWQMGTAGDQRNSLFQWIDDNVTSALKSDVDVVALSSWIGDAPLGLAHDEVFERLHAAFPAAQLAMGELGYWSQGTSKYWWWRDIDRPETTVRSALAQHMYLANLGFDYAVGGVFWWFYYQEMWSRSALWSDVNHVYRSVYDCVDVDADGACDFIDNCPADTNTSQADADDDGVGDVCDTVCPAGDQLTPGRTRLRLRVGADDQLSTAKASFATALPFDPVAAGVRVQIASGGLTLLDVELGGPGAPVQFTGSNGRFRYRDRDGNAGGITKADIRPDARNPGTYLLQLSGRRMDLEGISEPNLRFLVELGSACVETHSDGIYCTFRNDGVELRCE